MMHKFSAFSILTGLAVATVTITDPSDIVGVLAWEADNAILADYSPPPTDYHTLPYISTRTYTGTAVSLDHVVVQQTANDSSVAIFTGGTTGSVADSRFVKFGYSSNLIEASFFGINSAVWVGNGSSVSMDNVNITTHNGAANVYSYGTNSYAYISNSDLYSSGPVAHGLYAGGNGTIYANNIKHYSGGNRCSAFSGDSPAGYIHVADSVAHTDGIGSAVCYALGLCNVTNTIGYASRSPAMFMDGKQEAIWTGCDLTAGLLAGTVMFTSHPRDAGGSLVLDHSKLTVLGKDMAALWFGNTIASATVIASQINNAASGLLVIANFSQVTQDFNYFAGYADAPWLSPAEATVTVEESAVNGDIVAYNGSSISLSLGKHSAWYGKGYSGFQTSYLAVTLDTTSNWTLSGPTTLQNFTDADTTFKNVFSNGFNIYYDASSTPNKYLGSKTYKLNGGGRLLPDNGNRASHGYWGGYGMYHQKTPASVATYPFPTWNF